MNICFIGYHKFVDNITSGVHVSTLTLARELAKQGHRIFFYGTSKTHEFYVDEHQITHRYYVRDLPIRKKIKLSVPKELRKVMLEDIDHIDIYCFQSVFLIGNFLLGRVVQKARKPYVVVPRGGYNANIFERGRFKKFLFFHLMEKRYLYPAAGVICVSDSEESEVRKLGYKGPITTTYNPVITVPDTNGMPAIHPDNKKIIYLGRFDIQHKGLDILLAVSKEIQKLDNTIQVELYGNGPEKEKLLESIEKDHIRNVSVKEPVYGKEKIDVVRNAAAYIHTARWEGFGRSIAEAMMLGTPCIVSPGCAMATDIFQKYGLQLVLSHDPQKSASDIVNYLNDRQQLQTNAKKSKEIAYSLFKSDVVARKTYQFFQQVLGHQS